MDIQQSIPANTIITIISSIVIYIPPHTPNIQHSKSRMITLYTLTTIPPRSVINLIRLTRGPGPPTHPNIIRPPLGVLSAACRRECGLGVPGGDGVQPCTVLSRGGAGAFVEVLIGITVVDVGSHYSN